LTKTLLMRSTERNPGSLCTRKHRMYSRLSFASNAVQCWVATRETKRASFLPTNSNPDDKETLGVQDLRQPLLALQWVSLLAKLEVLTGLALGQSVQQEPARQLGHSATKPKRQISHLTIIVTSNVGAILYAKCAETHAD